MRTATLALAALLTTGAATAYASPFNANSTLQGLDDARYATVLTVDQGEARSLAIDVDVATLQQKIKNNMTLTRSVQDQGFSVDQIIGIDSDENGAAVTLYAL